MSKEKIAGIAAIAEIGLRRCFRGYASVVTELGRAQVSVAC